MRAKRRALSDIERSKMAVQIASIIMRSILMRRVRRVACYLPNDGEMDLTILIERLWSLGHICYLPQIDGKRLRFLPYEPNSTMVVNHFGIAEPALSKSDACPSRALDVVLMPLVAFDPAGTRIGMGGGYYDQTFAFKLSAKRWNKPRLIGVAYEFQLVAELPRQWWDIPLEGIVTEAGYREFRR